MLYICFIFLATFCTTLFTSPVFEPDVQNQLTYLDTKQELQSINDLGENLNEAIETTTVADEDENMQTADMIVFRPLFVYKKKTAQKYQVQNSNRRYFRPQYNPYRKYYRPQYNPYRKYHRPQYIADRGYYWPQYI